VWTGARLIFYGGYSYYRLGPGPEGYGFGTGNAVQIHDPVANTWTLVGGDAISGGRHGHQAVWDGSRMLIYGGKYDRRNYDSNFQIVEVHEARNSLVAYDPTANTWEMLGTLPASAGTSIVWTGRELLSWGGTAGSRFDPATKLWSPISTVGAPQPRANPAVAWDGEGMFVHGGFDGLVAIADGGRYFPHPITDGDADADGVSPCQGDCDDTDSAIHPGAAEACNGLDDDCDGAADDGNPEGGAACGQTDMGECILGVIECSAGALACVGEVDPAAEICNGLDDDCDGDVAAAEQDADLDGHRGCGGDCDDGSASTHPGAIDMPGNLADEDCNDEAVCSPAMAWKPNGAFVLCVVRACVDLVDAGQATPHQCLAAIAAAARSHVGIRPEADPAGDEYEEVLEGDVP
jgi:hypothetical protein